MTSKVCFNPGFTLEENSIEAGTSLLAPWHVAWPIKPLLSAVRLLKEIPPKMQDFVISHEDETDWVPYAPKKMPRSQSNVCDPLWVAGVLLLCMIMNLDIFCPKCAASLQVHFLKTFISTFVKSSTDHLWAYSSRYFLTWFNGNLPCIYIYSGNFTKFEWFFKREPFDNFNDISELYVYMMVIRAPITYLYKGVVSCFTPVKFKACL